MPSQDISSSLQAQVQAAIKSRIAVRIVGGGTKKFAQGNSADPGLETSGHSGIAHYDPTELVLTARTGTLLSEVEAVLMSEGQILAFEPPAYGKHATLGGTIACNLSGPRRPYSGAARDYVLGVKLLNGRGDIISFGGEVMKNVAGYDVSRLMAGALGTLGVLLEVSLKVLPAPKEVLTLKLDLSLTQALSQLTRLAQQYWPISASCYDGQQLWLRLEGISAAVAAAQKQLGGEVHSRENIFWNELKEQRHPFFADADDLWRVSLPALRVPLEFPGPFLIEWAGSLVWIKNPQPQQNLFEWAAAHGGHATLYRYPGQWRSASPKLAEALIKYHKNLKYSFDPVGIFNPELSY